MLDRVLLSRNTLIILCLPPWEAVLDKWRERKDEELIKDKEVMRDIYMWYQAYTPVQNTILYDYVNMSYKDLHRAVANITAEPHILRVLPNEGAGCTRPGRILLVGERCSTDSQLTIPFIGENSSGTWITNQLEEADIPETELYWINAKTAGGLSNIENVRNVIRDQRPGLICSLGGEASRFLEFLDVDFEPFAHPQYWKRFKHSHDYPLINYLENYLCPTTNEE